jgi:ribosomal protein S18 acetylase RimI-like enzyme
MYLSPAEIRQAIDLSWCDYFVYCKDFAAVEFYDGPDMLRYFTGLSHPFFNAVFRAQLPLENLDAAIAATLERARRHGLPLMWWTGPLSQPDDLGEHLQRHGLRLDDHEIGMALNLNDLKESAPPPDGVSITSVREAADLEDYMRVFGTGFDMEDYMVDFMHKAFLAQGLGPDRSLRHYLARLGGKAVGSAALLVSHGLAGIYNVAVLPEARRLGIARALTVRALQTARAERLTLAVLQASEMGVPVYRQLGFEVYCHLEAYISPV